MKGKKVQILRENLTKKLLTSIWLHICEVAERISHQSQETGIKSQQNLHRLARDSGIHSAARRHRHRPRWAGTWLVRLLPDNRQRHKRRKLPRNKEQKCQKMNRRKRSQRKKDSPGRRHNDIGRKYDNWGGGGEEREDERLKKTESKHNADRKLKRWHHRWPHTIHKAAWTDTVTWHGLILTLSLKSWQILNAYANHWSQRYF